MNHREIGAVPEGENEEVSLSLDGRGPGGGRGHTMRPDQGADQLLEQVIRGWLEIPGESRHLTPVPSSLALRANALADMFRLEPPPAFETCADSRNGRAFRFGFELGLGLASHIRFRPRSLPAGAH